MARPVIVDLGFGSQAVTTAELFARLRRIHPDIEVVGVEIDPERVAAAQALARPGLSFVMGGFEVPLPGRRSAGLIRAFNVLRQYDESEVPAAWSTMLGRLDMGALAIDGTCDELGRLASWVTLEASGPVSLTISMRLRELDRPSHIAERLPKVLIHRNVPGEPIHEFLGALDHAWQVAAPAGAFGVRQRFIAAAEGMASAGWPIIGGRSRWRLGELTVAWRSVAPRG